MNAVLTSTDLLAAAAGHDEQAWNTLVDRYAPLVYAICRSWRLSDADIDDVSQTVWLSLVNNLGRIREAEALPGWLRTTTNRECTRLFHAKRRERPDDLIAGLADTPSGDTDTIDGELLRAERNAALRAAFDELPEHCRRLLELLMSDPPASYADVSARLSMPCGTIGPTRSRCLDRLRRSAVLQALITEPEATT